MTILLQSCVVNFVTYDRSVSEFLKQPCYLSDDRVKLVTNCQKIVRTSSANNTHVRISQLVASLQQVWNNLLTTCNILADFVRLVTSLIQQTCFNHDITILLQPCFVNLVTFLLYRNCTGLVRTTLQQV